MNQNKFDKFLGFCGTSILLFFLLILIAFAGGSIWLSAIFLTMPPSEVLNDNSTPLSIEESWTVDKQFSIWIDSINEISSEDIQKLYPEIELTSKKKFFDITFSFQNIAFSGCRYEENKLNDYLTVHASVTGLDKNHKQVFIKEYSQNSFSTTLINGAEVPVYPGIISKNNHLFFEVDMSTENIEFVRIRFVIPVEMLSSETAVQYRQDYLFPLSSFLMR